MITKKLAENPRMMARSCRIRATTMRQIAQTLFDRSTKVALLRQAAQWDEMALAAEQRASAAELQTQQA
jgi:hypothetical protein